MDVDAYRCHSIDPKVEQLVLIEPLLRHEAFDWLIGYTHAEERREERRTDRAKRVVSVVAVAATKASA